MKNWKWFDVARCIRKPEAGRSEGRTVDSTGIVDYTRKEIFQAPCLPIYRQGGFIRVTRRIHRHPRDIPPLRRILSHALERVHRLGRRALDIPSFNVSHSVSVKDVVRGNQRARHARNRISGFRDSSHVSFQKTRNHSLYPLISPANDFPISRKKTAKKGGKRGGEVCFESRASFLPRNRVN